jgi:hypothetical protein
MPRPDALRRLGGAALAVLVTVSVLAACTSEGDGGGRRRTTTSSTTPTTVIDYSTVVLAGVAGATTSTIIDRGRASLVGTVTGPDGPVGGANVRIERIVGDQVRRTDVPAAGDGRFELRGVPGGRYRVRAFLPPSYAQVEPQLFFMPDGEERRLELRVERYEGLSAVAAIAPNPPRAGDAANLVVQIQTREVDGDGFVRAVPMVGVAVTLEGGARYSVPSGTTKTTDGAGRVTFGLVCEAPGPSGFSVVISGLPLPTTSAPPPGGSTPSTTAAPGAGTARRDLEVPACAPAPPVSSTTTTVGDDETTTTEDTTPDDGDGG